ncbi:MAG: putative molybdenum carrier protein [candidate division NC10 bacterium]
MKVISGGQTGADRAGLDAARACGLATGGYAPSNFWTERGSDPSLKALGLQAGGSLAWRTERNVVSSDASVVFQVRSSPGSNMTVALAARCGKPRVVLNPWEANAETELSHFLKTYRPSILNIAGHRESKAPGISHQVYTLLVKVFRSVAGQGEARVDPAHAQR